MSTGLIRRQLIALLVVGISGSASTAQTAPQSTASAPYRDARLPIAERVRDLLGRMTLEEKFWQLFMIPGDLDDPAQRLLARHLRPADPRPRRRAARRRARARRADQRHPALLRREDAARHSDHPVRGGLHGSCATARRCSRRRSRSPRRGTPRSMARVAARDRARDAEPRHPPGALAGRSTSPTTCAGDASRRPTARIRTSSSVMARAFVAPFERAGVVTTPKHFVANVGEGGRDSYPIDVSERAARGALLSAVRRRDPQARRAVGDDAPTTPSTARRRRRTARCSPTS